MKAGLSLRVKVMLTDPATHRYRCCSILVAVSVAISFVHYILCQAGKHARKNNSAIKTRGKRIEGFSKFSASTDLMLLSEVKCNYCCQFVKYVFA